MMGTLAALSGSEFGSVIYNRRNEMSALKIVASVLIIVGLLGLVYGNFSYTRETQEAKLGPLELSVKDTETVYVPIWVGVGAIVAGGGLLLFASRKS
jgi:uncharacterized membrane protein YidH (DUF202 family)